MSGKPKVALITGATRGLGRAMTNGFIAKGWTVCGCGRSRELIAELASRYPDPHQFESLDVTDAARVQDWADQLTARGHVPDLLINNAATINSSAPIWDVAVEDFSRVIDVNLKGVHNVLRAFLPSMISRGQGIVVNFSSGWGRSTSPEVAPYCATKWGIEGLTQALSQELPRGMAAVALNPGIIDTEMLRSCFAGGASNYPAPDQWSQSAVPFLQQLSARDNGKSLTVPGVPT